MSRSRLSRLLAVAAGVGSLAAAGSLATAGSALATTCSAGPLFASGSSFQNVAQNNVLIPGWATHTTCSTPVPTLTYTKSSSGQGLDEFGNNNGALDQTKDSAGNTANRLDVFVGTDDPPTAGNLGNAQVAAGSGNP